MKPACNRHKYIMVVVDDHTRYAWVYFLKKKSYVVAERLREFFALAQRQFDALVKKVRSDRGESSFRRSFHRGLRAEE